MTKGDNIPIYNDIVHRSTVIDVSKDYQPSYKTISCSPIFLSENGGAFSVTSIGTIAPAGIAMATDLGLADGELVVSGELPYLSTVAFEGQFDTNDAAAVSYGCGDGNIAITESIGNTGPAYGISSCGGYGCGKC